MNHFIIVLKRFWLVAAGTSFMLLLFLFEMASNHKVNKYTIYAADKRYEANEFNVAGKTIYFTDARTKHNVCITGEFTLIYETVPEK